MKQKNFDELKQIIASEYSNVAGIIIQKNGLKVFEEYFNGFAADDAVHVFSVTKSVISVLIGIAIDQGHILSTDQLILDYFPDYTVMPGEKIIQSITIKDLLTMTAPYKYEDEPYEAFFTSDKWLDFALDLLGGEKPAGDFLYTAIIGAHILSGILVKAVGRSVLEFAAEHLFVPLGINVTDNVVFRSAEDQLAWYELTKHKGSWVSDPQGIHTASWGLTLTAADMARIGQLFLGGGTWNDKQIVSSGWIRESTAEHSRWTEMNLSYGYLWWVLDNDERSFAAIGDGGNVIYVNEKKQIVVAVASLFGPEIKDRIELIKEYIEPLF